ncbi:MAG: amidohydrolase family protein [Planctomycetales bacterium]|nr:amidohydrolase family protein [Planctomycetales bacterium]
MASLLIVLVASAPVWGQRPSRQSAGQPPRDENASEEQKEPESDKLETKDKAKKLLAIVGGDIITVTRETIRGGTLLIEDDKILALGTRVDIPKEAAQIDATGKILCPGFVALSVSRVGLSNSSDSSGNYADGLDPFDNNVRLAVAVGITSGCQQVSSAGGRGRRGRATGEGFPINERFPGLDPDLAILESLQEQTQGDFGEYVSTCPCCGLPILSREPLAVPKPTPIETSNSAVIKMSYGVLDKMLLAENVFLDANPGSLIGAANQRNWREQIALARQYLRSQAEHEKAIAAGKKQQPPRKPVKDDVLRLVKHEVAMRISANTVSEMQMLVELSKELDYELVIDGAAECWVMGRELAEGDTSVILTPRSRRSSTFGAEDRSGTWIEASRVMQEHGVPFAVSALSSSISLNGLAGRDLTSLPLEAAFAVRGGASESTALAAITIVPATMMGLEDRIGSLEVGKDADVLILNGQPLDYRTYVETAIVNGNVVYERNAAPVLPVY